MQVSNKLIIMSLALAFTLTGCESHQEYVARQETDANAQLAKIPGLADCQYYQFNNMQVLRCPNSTVDTRHGKHGHDVIVDNATPAPEPDPGLERVKKCASVWEVSRAYEAAEVSVPYSLKEQIKEYCE